MNPIGSQALRVIAIGEFAESIPPLESRLSALNVSPLRIGAIERLPESFADSDILLTELAWLAGLPPAQGEALARRAASVAGWIALTDAGVRFKDQVNWQRLGVSHFFRKPLDSERLAGLVEDIHDRVFGPPVRALLVDDDESSLHYYSEVLRHAGIDAQAVQDPLLLVEFLDEHNPDVLVLDVEMPGCRGTELATIVRQNPAHARLPIIFLTASKDMQDTLQMRTTAAEDCLAKPAPPELLLAAIKSHALRYRAFLRGERLAARQQARSRLRLEQLRQAIDEHAIVSITDARGIIVHANERFCALSGYTREELLGQTHRIVKSGLHDIKFYAQMWNTIASGRVWQGELCNKTRDGRYSWGETTLLPILDDKGVPVQYIAIRTDITHVKAAEEAQSAQNAGLRIINTAATWLLSANAGTVDGVIDGCLALAGQHLMADRAYLFRLDDDDTSISNSHEWCAPGIAPQIDSLQNLPVEAVSWWWSQMERGEMIEIHDLAALPPDAAAVKALLESQGIRALCAFPIQEEGRTIGFIGFDQVRNIRRWDRSTLELIGLLSGLMGSAQSRTRMEKNLIAARESADRANQAKSDFLSSMSHELRTPMNAILGFTQMIECDPGITADQQDNVDEILKAGKHLLGLINEVLDLAKIESGRIDLSMEEVGLATLGEDCRHLMQPIADKAGIGLNINLPAESAVFADHVRLKQVLLNLLSNAIKYNRPGGQVTLDISTADHERLRLAVTDTGPGIAPERIDELFEPFNRLEAETSNIEGTGIGLTIVRRLMEMMGGDIGVDSTPGIGSTFWLDLPSCHLPKVGAGETAIRPSMSPPMQPASATVLCIEDNPANLKLIARVMGMREHIHLLTAHTPELGIELALAHRPALILLDINLPGMDGYQVLEIFKTDATLRNIPVIAITANALLRDIERGKAAGFADYLTKPIDVGRLLAAIDQHLRNVVAEQA